MPQQTHPVVVGVADDQAAVLRYAAAEAERRRVPLRVVHCWSMTELGAEFVVQSDSTTIMRTEAQRVLDLARSVVTEAVPTLEVAYVGEYGAPAAVLVQEARAATALIIGANDQPWFERFLDGELSPHLARVAACPVVVVPDHHPTGTGDGGVVVAIDGRTDAAGPLRYGFEQADLRGAVLHVIYAPPSGTWNDELGLYRITEAEIVAGWQEQFPGVEVLRSISSGGAAEACIEATAHAGLLVLGRPHGHSPFGLIRPVARAVLRNAECPVVVVPLAYGTPVHTAARSS